MLIIKDNIEAFLQIKAFLWIMQFLPDLSYQVNQKYFYLSTLTNQGISLDLSCSSLTQACQITNIISDILQGVWDHHNTHVYQISRGHIKYLENKVRHILIAGKKYIWNISKKYFDPVLGPISRLKPYLDKLLVCKIKNSSKSLNSKSLM